MTRITMWMCLGSVCTAALAAEPATAPDLTAEQVVERYVAARGGMDAWRKLDAMVWLGHIETVNSTSGSMPFEIEMKRPAKKRFEVKAQNQMAVRIFDGVNGWKMRASRGGKPEMQGYTSEELAFARDAQGLEGPLMDYQAKGVSISLDGMDEIDGRKAYRLNVKLPSGVKQHSWIDAQTFLEVKYDREARNAAGQTGTVSVYYRNYQTVEGLQMPMVIESGATNSTGAAGLTDTLVIDRVALNPPLDDSRFAKPNMPAQRRVVTVEPSSSASGRPPGASGPASQSPFPFLTRQQAAPAAGTASRP